MRATFTKRELGDDSSLTKRELGILLAASEGERTADMAQLFGVAEATIHKQRGDLLRKLGAQTMAQAVAIAYHTGILVPRRTGE